MAFWENISFVFIQSATLPVCLFVSLFVNLQFVSYYFTALNIFQGFSLNFARTLGHAVLIHMGRLFLESLEFVSRQHGFPTKP